MKIIFAGTPDIAAAVLKTLIETQQNIIACLTQPDRPQGRGLKLTASPVKEVAIQHNIPVLQPVSLKTADTQQLLIDLHADLMIVLAYGLILPQAVLNIPKLGCINIHASILPRWRGAAPIQHAILAGDTETGITIMQMDAGLDTGSILATYPCDIDPTYTSADLYKKLTTVARHAITDTLNKMQHSRLLSIPQNNSLATYAPKIEKAHAKIDWHMPAIEIIRRIKAYNPWPVAFTSFMQQTIRVWQAELVNDNKLNAKPTSGAPGTIVAIDKTGIQVATSNGFVRLLTLQFPNKKAQSAVEICHAHKELMINSHFI